MTREKRIEYARRILQSQMLPHVGTKEHCETKKAFFLGYMTHKLLMSSIGGRRPDDRDHYAQKRMDLAGPLLGQASAAAAAAGVEAAGVPRAPPHHTAPHAAPLTPLPSAPPQLFRMLFRKLAMQKYGQKCIDQGHDFSPVQAVRHKRSRRG